MDDRNATLDTRALESLLRWYVAMGVDAPVDERPHNRLEPHGLPRPAQEPAFARPSPRRDVPSRAGGASVDTLTQEAHALAAGAETLDELRAAWESLPGCGLAATASRMIFAGGSPRARLMLIGGAPDSDDEREGEVFAGAGGRLLDSMLRAIGFDRTSVYLTNVIPWRPPGNRPPSDTELAFCLPFTRRHIALIDPLVILCLGERAAQPLLRTADPISRLRGRWLDYEGHSNLVRTLVTFSPAYLMSQPLQKRRAWADLLMLEAQLAS